MELILGESTRVPSPPFCATALWGTLRDKHQWWQAGLKRGKATELLWEWSWKQPTAAFCLAEKLTCTASNPKGGGVYVESPFHSTPHVHTILWCHTPVALLWSLNGLPAAKHHWKHICPDCSFLFTPLSSVQDESLLDPDWLRGQSQVLTR